MIKDFLIVVALWLTALFIMVLIVQIDQAEAHKASYYSYEMGGRKTANGEIFDPNKLTAAHPTLPIWNKGKSDKCK